MDGIDRRLIQTFGEDVYLPVLGCVGATSISDALSRRISFENFDYDSISERNQPVDGFSEALAMKEALRISRQRR